MEENQPQQQIQRKSRIFRVNPVLQIATAHEDMQLVLTSAMCSKATFSKSECMWQKFAREIVSMACWAGFYGCAWIFHSSCSAFIPKYWICKSSFDFHTVALYKIIVVNFACNRLHHCMYSQMPSGMVHIFVSCKCIVDHSCHQMAIQSVNKT